MVDDLTVPPDPGVPGRRARPDLNAVCRAVAEAAGPSPSFELRLEGLGAFPSPARPRVIWAGPDGPGRLAAARACRRRVVQALTEAGYRPDDAIHAPRHPRPDQAGGGAGPPT